MKILFVSRLERWVRAVQTIIKYVELGNVWGMKWQCSATPE